MLIRTADQLNG